ncbi:fibronectin type III domain-containing protein [uncultured Flavobacterium sp.]|uniref:fibronectin type III domain-containing protein n=1 Tax=uncultured Flavobacterium sp. TaxID=165435 RepID=UPI00293103EF|nr:fibronectin type III domain-containing protein [uncultured Flavobacterium sp.]
MKNLFKHIIFFVALSFLGLNGAYAQLYPVQLTPIFNSPYSVKLSDYATSMDTKMQLLINPTDISISQRQVRLKLYIQGNGLNIQSSDYMQGQRPIFINGGELQTLTNTDIAALFRLENLQGITPQQYANGLPEGMYSFCFEMYDYMTNQKISQKSCASLYLILNDPPLLNTPQKNEQIAATDFPNILFTWTPRQRNATNISYKFELKQLIDPTLDPQFAFQMSPVLYEETLFGTALLYNLSMPILTPGMRYAWRVRAISTTGLSENAVFKNDGYSEIYSFKYTASCAAPTFLLSESQSSKSVKITWEGVPEHTRYQVQYKKQDVRNAQWFSTNSLNTQSLITNLEPGVTYQFRVGSSCDPVADGVQSFTYSGISTFTTPTETRGVPAYNCGIVPQINIQNQKPLTNLIQSETFKAGDFPVTILELKGENSPYSGRGYIIVPYLGDTKIAVEFNSIVINTDYQLISGLVETSYNPDWKNITDVEDFTGEGQGGQIEETVPFIIKDIVINANGDILVNGIDGQQVTIPGGKDTVITDSGGTAADGTKIPPKVYTVDKNGNGSNNGEQIAAGGKPTPENTNGVDKSGQATEFTAKGVTIAFSNNEDASKGAKSKYAFDVIPDGASIALKKLYKQVGNVALPYKAVLNGYTDTMLATVTNTDTSIKLDSIVFKTQNGVKIPAVRNDKVFVLTVKGNLSYAEEEILATIKQGDKWKVIGAFMLVHISPKNVNVALVPTYDISKSKADAIISSTQLIYDKVGVKINFTKEDRLKIDSVVPDSVAEIQTEKNTLISTYSSEQQRINALYHGSAFSYVLFITDKASSKKQLGYMRLNGQFGYVFNSANDKTPAHELGHGIFKLEHPFEQYKTSESGTDLLMDNGSGAVLNHQDWKQINDPAFKLYAFQSQASGESLLIKGLTDDLVAQLITLPSSANTCLNFAVGNGKFVKFDQATFSNFEKINIVDGVLKSIYLKENNSLGKIGGDYKFIMSYKPIKTVQNGESYEVVSTSDLVCADCIRKDDKILKNTVKGKDNQSITSWADSELTKKYTLLQDGQYIDCSSGMCVTIGVVNNNYKTKILSQTDCDQYIKENKLFDSNEDVCDPSRFITTIDPKHLADIKNKINSVKSLTTSIDTPLSTKKYVHKLGNYSIEKEDLLNVLEDRFRMLYETTKNNIYFVPLSMAIQADGKQYFYNKETLDKLTKDVFESCGLGNNDVLLVLPFDNRKDTKCLPLGIAKKGSAVLSDGDIQGLTGNWDAKVLQLFSKVAKPLTVSSYYLTATGRFVRFSKKSSGNIKGYSAIKVLQFFESKGYAEINQLNQELNTCNSGIIDHQSGQSLPCREVWSLYQPFSKKANDIYFKYSNLELAAGGMQSKDIWNEISKEDIGKLREPFMDDKEITDQIWIDSKVNWTWRVKAEISLGTSKLDAKKHFYSFSKLAVLDDAVYSTLDAVGSIPGFDTFTDPFGAIYAGVRRDNTNTVIYSASFAIPFAGSAYIKGGIHEIKEAGELWGIVAKKADNVDGFVLDVKKISDIRADEFHVSSLVYGNEKDLTDKVLKDADKYVDKNFVKSQVDGLSLLKDGKVADNVLGTIAKNGNKIEYTNPAGKLLKWTEQGINDINNAIATAKNLDPLNTNNIGRITEGKVADFIKQEGKIVEGFGLTIKKADNSIATDIDIITSNEIIEVKNSMAVWEKKPNQVNRFVNSTLEDFVNPQNKKAILYIEKPLSDLDKAKILNTIPNNVTLVNSLTELKTILK